MPTFEPFAALRPDSKYAAEFAALPYDVYSREEARSEIRRHPLSFLRIDKAEATLPSLIAEDDPRVYQQAALAFEESQTNGILQLDADETYYIYQLSDGTHTQSGFVGCVAVSDYETNQIRKHEFTRPDKERDRVRHVEQLQAHTGPILLAHQTDAQLEAIVTTITAGDPLYDFTVDGVTHRIYKITDRNHLLTIGSQFARHDALYIADGHHRAAAAAIVASRTDQEEAQRFLGVSFPQDQLRILGYHRVVEDLYGQSVVDFLERLAHRFTITKGRAEQTKPHQIEMYLNRQWYTLSYDSERTGTKANLDVSILQEELLTPLLGIEDPRTDARIQFVGGHKGYAGLEQIVDTGHAAVAFHLHPTSIEDLMAVADAGEVMPPKSTWFEPKLRSGLLIHPFDS